MLNKNVITSSGFSKMSLMRVSLCFFFALLMLKPSDILAQCPVTAQASNTSASCGESITLTAVPSGTMPLNNDFNGNTLGTWGATAGAVVTDGTGTYTCMGASPDPSYYVFMGSTANTPRYIQSSAYNLSGAASATACFYMKYSTQGTSGTCEGPDLSTEGVYLEYSTDCSTWTQISYWDPNGGFDSQRTSWNQYCVSIPAAALTAATCFRWIQKTSSGVGYDTWAIDKVQIILSIPGYTYDWGHDAQAANASPSTPTVNPTATTTYTVTYSNVASGGSDVCVSSVVVNVTTPQVTISDVDPICSGANVELGGLSPYQYIGSSTCGLSSPAQYCDPASATIGEFQVGSGATVNSFNSITSNVFGDFGYANANTQILFKASELLAAGVKAGKITSISFNISKVENSGTGAAVTSATYQNFSISMKCASITTLTAFQTGLSEVFTPKSVTITTGWTANLNFDNYYEWDGSSNIIVQVCWYLPNGESRTNQVAVAKTIDNAPGYDCLVQSHTNFSPGSCATSSPSTASQRPNVKFGNCQPEVIDMTYSWSPATGLSSSTSRTPTASPTTTTTYTLTSYPTNYPGCSSTANVVVEVVRPSASISPANPGLCPASGINNVTLTATGTSPGTFSSSVPITYTSDATSTAIPNNNATGISKSIVVTGITPTTLASNPPVSVCVNITHTADADVDITLISPSGTSIDLSSDNGGSGDNYTSTCFSTTGSTAITAGSAPFTGTYTPEQAFSNLTGNVNGTWTLTVKDDASGLGTGTGNFVSWNITFNTGPSNTVVGYSWSPSTGLSSTTIENPVANPTTTTYTLALTDAMGCTSTQSVVVSYCAPLPVEMLNELFAVRDDNTIKLTWTTAQEINNDYFIIEKSTNSTDFSEIGRITGKGNSYIPTAYTFIDREPQPGTNYYRLRQVDFDGISAYTPVSTVNYSLRNNGLVLDDLNPVPAVSTLNYTLHSPLNNDILVQVMDISGKVMSYEKMTVHEGFNRLSTNVSLLPQGIYFIRLSTDDGQFAVRRFTK